MQAVIIPPHRAQGREIPVVEKEATWSLWKVPTGELQYKPTEFQNKPRLSKQRTVKKTASVILPGPGGDRLSDLEISNDHTSTRAHFLKRLENHKVRQAQEHPIIK